MSQRWEKLTLGIYRSYLHSRTGNREKKGQTQEHAPSIYRPKEKAYDSVPLRSNNNYVIRDTAKQITERYGKIPNCK